MSLEGTVRIGTRRSALALWQARYVRDALARAHPGVHATLVEITTEGDRTLDVPLSTKGGKGLFLKELEQALLGGRIDIAVHSMKDVTVALPEGLHIPVVCKREDPRDALVSNRHDRLEALEQGARVGTCSLRRQCWLRRGFPHLEVQNLRGNVNTRLARLDAGDFDALILAAAGLKRLGFEERIAEHIPVDVALPAVGQGVVGIECRATDSRIQALLAPLDHPDTAICIRAERAANARLGGGCHVPVAVFAELAEEGLRVRGMAGMPDGSRVIEASVQGSPEDPGAAGVAVAERLLAQGARRILDAAYGHG